MYYAPRRQRSAAPARRELPAPAPGGLEAGPIAENLAAILRTRAAVDPALLAAHGLEGSMLGFGLPDLSVHDPRTPQGRMAIAQAVAVAIRRGEPRLEGISVIEARHQDGGDTVIHLRAQLREAGQGELSIRTSLGRGDATTELLWYRGR